MEKTVKQIDEWFNSEVRDALKDAPQGMKDMAKKNREAAKMLAEYVARKKNFRVPAVLKYLDTLI